MPAEACSPTGMAAWAAGTAAAPPTTAAPVGAPAVPGESVRARLQGAHRARFQVGDLLGVGATGEVYTVADADLERQVALKILRPELLEDTAEVANFLHEAATTARLSHPNMLPVLDVNLASDGRPYFTMHRIQGRTLLDAVALARIGQTTQPPTQAAASDGPVEDAQAAAAAALTPAEQRRRINRLVSIAIAVCHGLGYAHAQGIIHQDIKPENLLLGDYGEVLILDWGSAGACGPDGRVAPHQLYGTPLYMSPEQASRAYADARSDVYALGATLCYALLGRVPWWRTDPDAFWVGKREGRIDAPTAEERGRVPAELLAIVLKALAADPAQRYASVAALRRDLEQYQAGLTVHAYHYAPWTLAWRWVRHHPGTATAALIALCALAGLGATLGYWRSLQARAWHPLERLDFTSTAALRDAWQVSHEEGWTTDHPHVVPQPTPLVTVAEGWMTLDGSLGLVDVSHTPAVAGNERITWEMRNPHANLNLNCFIGGDDRAHAVTLHIGGWGVATQVVITNNNHQLEWATLPEPLQVNRIYRCCLEHEDRHLRFFLDDRLIVDHLDVDDALGAKSQTFGFDTYLGSQLQVRHVEVFQQTPGQLVSPLLVPDQLAQLQLWPQAIRGYRTLAQAYPGTTLGTLATYHAIECVAAAGDHRDADAHYAAFITAHPHDPLVPSAMVARLSLALERHDTAEVAALRDALSQFAGNPLLRGVLSRIGEELGQEVPPVWVATAHVEQTLTQLLDLAHRYHTWCDRYGLAPIDQAPIDVVVHTLDIIGHPEAALPLLSPRSTLRVEPLEMLGRMDEAQQVDVEGWVDLDRGRFWKVAHDPHAAWSTRQWACLALGDFDLLRQLNPHSELLFMEHLTSPTEAEAYLAHHPLDAIEQHFGYSTRIELLLHLGRAQEVLATYTSPEQPIPREMALIELGREDEALAKAGGTPPVYLRAAIRLLAHGEPMRALQALPARLPVFDESDDQMDLLVLVPALLHAAAGDAAGARRLLAGFTARKDVAKQRWWHLAGYALGMIDERTFRAQPYQSGIDQWERIGRGVRCELAGDLVGACAAYRPLVDLPLWQRAPSTVVQQWIGMRLRQAGIAVPWNWGVGVILQNGVLSTR